MTKPKTRTPPKDDRWEPTKSGQIETVIAGVARRLRRPTIGEQRRFVETLNEMSVREKEYRTVAADSPDRVATSPVTGNPQEIDDDLLDFWRDVVDTLRGEADPPLPESSDDLPPWLLSRPLISETRNHWMQVPWGPGGSPSQQEAKEVAPLIQAALAGLSGQPPTT